ncbi:DegT/DnrJ/EryC1/StrS family aminotransferase [Pedobacter sp. NJ-S-72]
MLRLASRIRDYGIDRSKFRDSNNEISAESDIEIEGYGALLSDVNAYIGHQQMADLPNLLSMQRVNAENWKKYFQQGDRPVQILGDRKNINPNYWVFSILTDQKNQMLEYFRGEGYYASGIHINNNIYSAFGNGIELKGVSEFVSRHLALPSGWWVSKNQLQNVGSKDY